MLVLSRKVGQQIVLPDCEIVVTVVAIDGNKVNLGTIAAPKRSPSTVKKSGGKPASHPSISCFHLMAYGYAGQSLNTERPMSESGLSVTVDRRSQAQASMPLQPRLSPTRLRLWPAVLIVVVQWLAIVVPGWVAPVTMAQFMRRRSWADGGGSRHCGLVAIRKPSSLERSHPGCFRLGAVGGGNGDIVRSIGRYVWTDHTRLAASHDGVGSLARPHTVAWLAGSANRTARAHSLSVRFLPLSSQRRHRRHRLANLSLALEDPPPKSSSSPTSPPKISERISDPSTQDVSEQPGTVLAVLEAGDWPGFRGPNRDSRLTGVRIATNWTTNPPRQVWRHRVGPGWSSFTVVGKRIFTQEQRGDDEVVVCYHADTGAENWVHNDKTRFNEVMAGPGPRATPTFHEGKSTRKRNRPTQLSGCCHRSGHLVAKHC